LQDPALVKAVRQCRRRADDNSAVPVSFNSTWPAGELWIRQNLAPTNERFGLSNEFYLHVTAGSRTAVIAGSLGYIRHDNQTNCGTRLSPQ
jgi:hypothetical protein